MQVKLNYQRKPPSTGHCKWNKLKTGCDCLNLPPGLCFSKYQYYNAPVPHLDSGDAAVKRSLCYGTYSLVRANCHSFVDLVTPAVSCGLPWDLES